MADGVFLLKRQRFIWLWALLFYVALSVIVTWPLVLHWKEMVPGWYVADNYEYLWKMWWFKEKLLHGQSPFFAPRILYPYGYNLAYSELTFLHTVVGLPLTLFWGEVPAYNFFALLSFVLSGWGAFGFMKRVGMGFWPALFSGVVYMLTPYHVERYAGILPLMSVEGIPLFLWGVEEWLFSRKVRWALFAGLGGVLAAWSSMYYALGIVLFGGVYIGVRLRPWGNLLRDKHIRRGIMLMGIVFVFGVAVTMFPYLQLRNRIALKIPLEETDYWSASLSDYLVPPGLHPLWGQWVREHLLGVPATFPSIGLEFVLGVGFVSLLFALYGWRRGKSSVKSALIWFTVFALVLSMGPRLRLGRSPVVIPAPESVVQGFNQMMDVLGAMLPAHESYAPLEQSGLSVPLPALLLRWLLPPLLGMRAWNRFAAFASLGLALLAGLGVDTWLREEVLTGKDASSTRLVWTMVIVLGVAIFELWPGSIPLQPVKPRAVDLWLASQPEDFTIMELPLTSALSGPQMMYTRYHGKRTAFAAGYLPYWYREQFPELEHCPADACIARLRSWEVRYILLNRAALGTENRDLESQLDASPVL
ncbi:hypothetical protein D6779_10440, partial [Candidatus Parcubacteria bacterium]